MFDTKVWDSSASKNISFATKLPNIVIDTTIVTSTTITSSSESTEELHGRNFGSVVVLYLTVGG